MQLTGNTEKRQRDNFRQRGVEMIDRTYNQRFLPNFALKTCRLKSSLKTSIQEVQERMKLNVDEFTTTLSLFGIFGLS